MNERSTLSIWGPNSAFQHALNSRPQELQFLCNQKWMQQNAIIAQASEVSSSLLESVCYVSKRICRNEITALRSFFQSSPAQSSSEFPAKLSKARRRVQWYYFQSQIHIACGAFKSDFRLAAKRERDLKIRNVLCCVQFFLNRHMQLRF